MENWLEKLLAEMKAGAKEKDLLSKYPELQKDPERLKRVKGVSYLVDSEGVDFQQAQQYYFEAYPEKKTTKPATTNATAPAKPGPKNIEDVASYPDQNHAKLPD